MNNNENIAQDELEARAATFKSTLISRNITVLGHRTSVRLEPEMWLALKEISIRENCSIHDICSLVHLSKNDKTSLTAAIRVFLMLYYRASSTEEGHISAGHGSFDNMKMRARMTCDMKELKRGYKPSENHSYEGNSDRARVYQ